VENSNKKKLKWLWIALVAVVVVALLVWCVVNAVNNPKSETILGQTIVLKEGAENVLNFSGTLVLFTIAFVVIAVGYLLGSIDIKGVSLGTAGVFLIAILVGYLCSLIPEDAGLFAAFRLTETSSVVNTFKGTLQNTGLIFAKALAKRDLIFLKNSPLIYAPLKGNRKCAALAKGAFYINFTAENIYNTLHESKSKTVTLCGVGAITLIEFIKDAVSYLAGHSAARICYANYDVIITNTKNNRYLAAARSKLKGVGE
jgi:hypothetical protein